MWQFTNLNIEEILKPISYYKEQSEKYRTPEYEEIRNKIKELSSQIKFKEAEHRYFYNDVECIPVSYVCEMFQKETDFDLVAQNFARKNNIPNWEDVRRWWRLKGEQATTSGTFNHQFGEDMFHIVLGEEEKISSALKQFALVNGYYYPLCPKQIAICKYFHDSLSMGEIPIEAEIKLVWKEFFISGTFDKLIYSPVKKGLVIRDYKTNSVMTKSFKKPLLSPFENLNDESLSHYIIQQSLYQIMLENLGFEIKDRELIWLKETEKYDLIPLPNVTDKLRKAIPLLAA